MRWRGTRSLTAPDVRVARANMHEGSTRYADAPQVGAVRDFEIETAAGPLRVRHYSPVGVGPDPLLVFFHGGGFSLGDIETHDLPCRLLVRSARAHVLSVDYRLAPEHPFPAALDDAQAAVRWAIEHAAKLGADPQRVAVGGDSAGGNLATVIAHDFARDGGPSLRAQLLIYPPTDLAGEFPSRKLFGEGLVLTRRDADWFDAQYMQNVTAAEPRVSPLRAADLSGLCPALVVTAGFDALRDEGEAYAGALRRAGNHVVSWRERGLLHGFVNYAGISRESRAAVKRIGNALSELLRR
jgi:acetyl esterase/lipase